VPDAVRCVDPFHVVMLASEALDDVRREVWNEARRRGNLQLARERKGARFAVWKNPEVRHEALSRRAGMKGPCRWPVAAGWLKLRAA
jgi:transposase